jgi:ATP adenylyltransferase
VANRHLPTLEELDQRTRAEMMELATHAMTVLRRVYRPEAFNLGANIGELAGAGIAGHVHLHVVPRWGGDTSFMSVVGEARVLPEELSETYRRVHESWS